VFCYFSNKTYHAVKFWAIIRWVWSTDWVICGNSARGVWKVICWMTLRKYSNPSPNPNPHRVSAASIPHITFRILPTEVSIHTASRVYRLTACLTHTSENPIRLLGHHMDVFQFPHHYTCVKMLTGQLADKPTRSQSSRGLDNSRTGQLSTSVV